ncbi:3-oxoacid CoA-transferase subunit B [Bordetella bronchialis]|uniref:3-oxoadipate CoA-transferase n=1 Tax=Bordetella bronchialis TaxID=463025 RepID=A0A193FNK3_9BORD|nr:3-oxoacid CoA-transferase subunit B [Bordetella bronchialis]ANN68679.1 3-oxoadipate CoA-transferase [Bordetella bronchialis]ANN73819.1 3-oxoadipate CoA-transferase [Bordetella bronchialis]
MSQSANKLSRDRVAQQVAAEIAPGSYVNIGLGMPTLVAKYLDPAKEIILHSENGILGIEDVTAGDPGDEDLINASKARLQLIPGASICDQSLSFAMMRGGHLDATILGAFQVSCQGDIASWATNDTEAVPGIGGAMDLVAGARKVIVVMEHTTRDGRPKLLRDCTFPLTGKGVVDTIYTDMAVIDVDPARGFVVRAMARGLSREALQAATAAPLSYADDVALI